MKRFTCMLVAIAAMTLFGISETQAQQPGCCNGYGFYNYGYNFNNSGFERPPYFALYPPVHYSDQIIPRPMGISPFAAPPGVMPVEMTIPAEPQVIQNPYFKEKAKPVSSGILDSDT